MRLVRQAIRIYVAHWRTLAAIVLTFWLPVNLMIEYWLHTVAGPENAAASFRANSAAEFIVGPIEATAFYCALSRTRGGGSVSYSESMRAAFPLWTKVFYARVLAGLLVLLGLVAFIIPGVYFLIRSSLLDPAVVIGNAPPSRAWRVSFELTRGRVWQLITSGLLAFLPGLAVAFSAGALVGFFPRFDTWWSAAVTDSLGAVMLRLVSIVIFLIYVEATSETSEPRLAA